MSPNAHPFRQCDKSCLVFCIGPEGGSDPHGPWGGRAARCPFHGGGGCFYFHWELLRSEVKTLLAGCPLVLEDSVDIVHLAQLLKERDEVQQLRVGHVVEPRGHRNLQQEVNQNKKQMQKSLTAEEKRK